MDSFKKETNFLRIKDIYSFAWLAYLKNST